MRRACSCFRPAGLALISALLGGVCVSGAQPADGDTAEPQLFSPEIEAKLTTFVASAKLEKEKVWDARMTEEIDHIVHATGLDADHAKILKGVAKQAVAAGLDRWAAQLKDRERTGLARRGDQAGLFLDQITQQAAMVAQSDWSTDITQPYEQDAWIAAVHQALTSDQAAAWDKTQAARQAEIEKDISSDTLKQSLNRMYEQQTQEIQSACAEIVMAVGLPKDRSDKLAALAKDVADQTKTISEKKLERIFLLMNDDQRRQIIANGNIYFDNEPNELPSKQAAWTQGVASLLTTDEMTRLQAERDAHKAKWMHVMGQIMLTILDDKIAFSEEQRQKLEPLAERLVKDVPNLFTENAGNSPPQLFLSVAAKAPQAELRPVLDDLQLRHWRELSAPPGVTANAADDAKANPDETVEPEDVEKAISLYLYEKTEERRKHALEENVLKAEDAIRTAKLGDEAATRLKAAARGATEESLTTWKWFVEQQIRAQLQNNVTPQNVKQRLESLQIFLFQQNINIFNGQAARPSIWDATVTSELTPSQQDLWKKETDTRSAFRDKAVADLVLAEFDARYHLTDDQGQKLQPLLTTVIHDCSPDISRMFSGGNANPWYLMNQFALMPFAGISDSDLNTILTKDQSSRWTESQDHGNAMTWWTNVQQIHNQRIQQEKQQAQHQAQFPGMIIRRLPQAQQVLPSTQ
jgi:hypothetical protein